MKSSFVLIAFPRSVIDRQIERLLFGGLEEAAIGRRVEMTASAAFLNLPLADFWHRGNSKAVTNDYTAAI